MSLMRTSTKFGRKGVSECSDGGMVFSGVGQDEWDGVRRGSLD